VFNKVTRFLGLSISCNVNATLINRNNFKLYYLNLNFKFYYLSSTLRCDHSARSDQTQLNAFDQSGPVEPDCKSDHSESGAVITLIIFPD
jgi:hypothetical protein